MIEVTLRANGYLKKHFPNGESYRVKLENDATMKDFYDRLDALYGDVLPSSIWSRDKKSFRRPMVISVSGEAEFDLDYKLRDGDDITISRVIIGG